MALTVGDIIPFSAEVYDSAGVLANAGTMTLTVTKPDLTAESGSPFTITSTTTGIYDKDITSEQAGRYVGKWVATGINSGSHTQVFTIRSGDETAIVSLAEVKDHLNIPQATTTHDQELERFVGAATGVVEYFCGPVVQRTYTDEVPGGGAQLVLPRDQILSVTSVTPILTTAPSVTVGDLDPSPTGILRHIGGLPISFGTLRVVYVAGRTGIPDELIEAALIITKHLWETQRGPGRPSVLGQSTLQAGDVTFLPVQGFAIPNRALDLMKVQPAPAGIA